MIGCVSSGSVGAWKCS